MTICLVIPLSVILDTGDGGPISVMPPSVHSGKCLDVLAGSTDDLTKVVQYDCDNDSQNQLWQIKPPNN